ncbi:hypothetical protein TUN205_01792, partial [Pyrenophora tritici-repentis]
YLILNSPYITSIYQSCYTTSCPSHHSIPENQPKIIFGRPSQLVPPLLLNGEILLNPIKTANAI